MSAPLTAPPFSLPTVRQTRLFGKVNTHEAFRVLGIGAEGEVFPGPRHDATAKAQTGDMLRLCGFNASGSDGLMLWYMYCGGMPGRTMEVGWFLI